MKSIAIAAVLSLFSAAAHAAPVDYSGYSVLNPQNVLVNDAGLGVNELAAAGQISLSTPGGIIAGWCIDIAHTLAPSGTFQDGGTLGGQFGSTVNALLSHVDPAAGPDASAALQVAIWRAEYGDALGVSASEQVAALSSNYLSHVASGAWSADPSRAVAVLSGGGSTQDQARLVAVPEPASLAVLGAGLVGLGLARRRRGDTRRGKVLDIIA